MNVYGAMKNELKNAKTAGDPIPHFDKLAHLALGALPLGEDAVDLEWTKDRGEYDLWYCRGEHHLANGIRISVLGSFHRIGFHIYITYYAGPADELFTRALHHNTMWVWDDARAPTIKMAKLEVEEE
jgi:hypothetical protein